MKNLVFSLAFVMALGPVMLPAIAAGAQKMRVTPLQVEGPYYPTKKLADRDNDLTRVGNGIPAKGQVLLLSGQLVDELNNPISSARIELWQTDQNGIYMHPRDEDTASRDQNFQFYGESLPDDTGQFSFRTIVPGIYGTRPRHAHVKIIPRRGDGLTTQLYFKGDERLKHDRFVRRLGERIAALLLDPVQRGSNELHATITFVLQKN